MTNDIMIHNNSFMLVLTFGISLLIAGAFLIWTYTESGKKWLKNL